MLELDAPELETFDKAAGYEWLATNAAGGFASGTVAGAPTRRYHALLVANLGTERMTLLSKVDETLSLRGEHFNLSTNRYSNNVIYPDGWRHIVSFSALPVPTWTYRLKTDVARGGEIVLVKRIYMAREKNTVYVTYTLRESEGTVRPSGTMGGVTLVLAPLVCWKSYHSEMHAWNGFPFAQGAEVGGWSVKVTKDAPTLRLLAQGAGWTKADWWNESIVHSREQERGLDFQEDLYCPALATLTLRAGQNVALVATIEDEEPQDAMLALADIVAYQKTLLEKAGDAASDTVGNNLVLAADSFLVRTGSKSKGRATIIAGYPWFTDWGRDACIALPGLCLTTGRVEFAREILETFAFALSEGMIPNRFPDGGETPDYNNVDATLWFVHACGEYLNTTGDTEFQSVMSPIIAEILNAYEKGTRYGIKMDAADSLLQAGEAGVQLTWMDAKVGDWVVTPRTGKPVEVNALWINALRIAAAWGVSGGDYAAIADRASESFLTKFVRPDGLGLYDFLHSDGKDTPNTQIRPNQIIATALPGSPCTTDANIGVARAVLETVQRHLLTPVGLRSLAPSDAEYQGYYHGDSRQRDGAYHQGTVWAWLIGSFVDTYRRVHGEEADVQPFLTSLEEQLREYGILGVGEIFEGNSPNRPDGCPWQAWSVAELLRVRRPVQMKPESTDTAPSAA